MQHTQMAYAGLPLITLLALSLPAASLAEWYVGGYGGVSTAGEFADVTMNAFGLRMAQARYPTTLDPTTGDTLTQNFKTSDLKLASSPLFGGKAGYFFDNYNLPWLGVELEAFTTKPTIKQTTVRTIQDISFIKNPPFTVPCLGPPVPTCSMGEVLSSRLQVAESELRVTVVALNVIARYPGKIVQPYLGAGAGAFYFQSSSGGLQGRQWIPGVNLLAGLKLLISDEWGVFAEWKYNRATLSNFDPTFGFSGEYSIFHFVGGVAYHF